MPLDEAFRDAWWVIQIEICVLKGLCRFVTECVRASRIAFYIFLSKNVVLLRLARSQSHLHGLMFVFLAGGCFL